MGNFIKRRFLSCIALGLNVCLSLSGCGSQTSVTSGQEQSDGSLPAVQNVVTDKLYDNEVMELPEGVSARLVQFSGEKIYLGGASQDQDSGLEVFEISILSLEGELLQSLTLPLEKGLRSARYCVRDDGSICISAESVNTGGPGTLQALLLFDSKGELLTKTDLTVIPGLRDLQLGPYPVMADDKGRISLLADNAIYLFDEQGNYQDSISFEEGTEGWTITRDGDGSVYTVYASGNRQYLARVDYENKELVPVGQGFPDGRNSGMEVYAAGETSFWCSTGTTLYKYDYASGERILFFDWTNQGIKGDSVKGVTGSEEELKILVRNGGSSRLYTLTPLSEEEMAYLTEHGPTVITLAGPHIRNIANIEDAVIAFNASQRQYKVELLSYADPTGSYSGKELAAAGERLARELLLDTAGIDLICSESLRDLDVEALLEQGALEDLTPWLENSTVLKREDLFESVLQAFTIDGSLIAIPKYFRLSCLTGSASVLGDQTGWTLDELLDFADQHPDDLLFSSKNISTSLTYEDMFLEEKDGELVFNEEQCRRYLEMLNSLPDQSDGSGRALLSGEYVYSFLAIKEAFLRNGETVFTGLPTANGGKGLRIDTGLTSFYAISSQSDCKEGAWAFLEFYLNYEDGFLFSSGGFSIQKSFFESQVENWLNPQSLTMVYRPELGEYSDSGTQEEVDVVLELINRGGYWLSKDKNALDLIISEEAEPYFRGDKDLNTVVDIIGNRWMLYQAEKG